MMDLAMVAILLACFGLMKLFAGWCSRQVDTGSAENKKYVQASERIPIITGGDNMILLGIVILLIAAYLFYALVYPEKL